MGKAAGGVSVVMVLLGVSRTLFMRCSCNLVVHFKWIFFSVHVQIASDCVSGEILLIGPASFVGGGFRCGFVIFFLCFLDSSDGLIMCSVPYVLSFLIGEFFSYLFFAVGFNNHL